MLKDVLQSNALYIGDVQLSNFALLMVVFLLLLLVLLLLREVPRAVKAVRR